MEIGDLVYPSHAAMVGAVYVNNSKDRVSLYGKNGQVIRKKRTCLATGCGKLFVSENNGHRKCAYYDTKENGKMASYGGVKL